MALPSFLEKLQITSKQLTSDELKAVIQARGLYDFEFFVRYFFAHYCEFPFSRMHLDFCQAEQNPYARQRRDVIAAPRGHAKTTFKTLFKVVHAIVYGYEPFVVIASYSRPQAVQKVKDILDELTHNLLLHEVFGALAPKPGRYLGRARWGTSDFTAQNGCRVVAISRGQSSRGMRHGADRPSLIICDDVESLEGVYELKQREKTLDWFQKDILKLGQSNNSTNITVVGTVLHPESLLSFLLKNPGWNSHFYQAVEHFADHQSLWNDYKSRYTNLSDLHRKETAHLYFKNHEMTMMQGVKVLWPESDSYEKLFCMQIDEGKASFQSEKQNEPFDPERQIFNMPQAKRFTFLYEQGFPVGVCWQDGSNRQVLFKDFEQIVAFHDPAMASSKDSDYAAIVVVGLDKEEYLYCLDAYLEKVPVSRQLEQAYHLQAKWGFQRLYLETNNFQGILQMNYKDKALEYPQQSLSVIPVTQTQNKAKRISTLEPLISNGYLLFSNTLPELFITQMHLFPTTHDDGPDALHGAVSQLKKRLELPLLSPIQTSHNREPYDYY